MKKRKKHTPVWAVVLLDLLLVGVILLTFAFFHHVLPAIIIQQQLKEAALQSEPTEVPETTALPETTPSPGYLCSCGGDHRAHGAG